MTQHRAILPYAPVKAVAVIVGIMAISITYHAITGTVQDIGQALVFGLLLVWFVAWAGRELHEMQKAELPE